MFEWLEMKNFQKHKLLTVEFDPHVTVIIGPSDVGKSSVLRAIRWLAFNKPVGTSFIRQGSTFARVRLGVDGRVFTRKRSESKNLYALDDQEFLSFSQAVPEDIQKVLNLSDINFQRQHEPSFLFSKTPGEVSKELNAVVNLAVIDDTLTSVASSVRAAKSSVQTSRERLQGAQEALRLLSWVDLASEALEGLEALQGTLNEVRRKRESLEKLAVEMGAQEALIGEKIPEGELAELEETAKDLEAVKEDKANLSGMVRQIDEQEKDLWTTENSLRRDREELRRLMGEICPLCQSPLDP